MIVIYIQDATYIRFKSLKGMILYQILSAEKC